MKNYLYKGQIVTASSKEEAIGKLVNCSGLNTDVYRKAIEGIDFDKLIKVLIDAGIFYARDMDRRAPYNLSNRPELQKAVLNNDLGGVKKFVKEWDEANKWDGSFYPALGKKLSSIAKDILSRYHKGTPFIAKVDKQKLMEKAMQRAMHDAGVDDIGKLSDGYHTFDDLYYQRLVLWVRICKDHKDKAWKTKRHEDGELCFGGTNFLICIDTPEGPYSYHYPMKYWNMFDCAELPKAKPFDGHTSKDVERILSL